MPGWREAFRADAVIHLGKHGTLEWLPGKALALSAECFPEAALGPLPHLYPFIVNDPGEGTQAKRRAQAVIVDHLTPPLTRAGSYGRLAELERLIDEYYEAAHGDPRRVAPLAAAILERARAAGLDARLRHRRRRRPATALRKLDGFLCELKEMQIRDGLHVFGQSPEGGAARRSCCVAFARARAAPRPEDASLLRALAADLGLGFDPLAARSGRAVAGPRPPSPPRRGRVCAAPAPRSLPRARDGRGGDWRTAGDTVERLEALALRLVAGEAPAAAGAGSGPAPCSTGSRRSCGRRSPPAARRRLAGLLAGLDGRFVPPGPSGAPSRGRPEVLPTGRNFFSLDTRAVPTPAAWQLGWKSAGTAGRAPCPGARRLSGACRAVGLGHGQHAHRRRRHRPGAGADGRAAGLGAGERPRDRLRDPAGARARPAARRCDLARLRLFPRRLSRPDRSVDSAARAVAALDEPAAVNPLAARVAADRARSKRRASRRDEAARRAGYRVFGSKPGAYGAGLQTLIDERTGRTRPISPRPVSAGAATPMAPAAEGRAERAMLEARLAGVEAVVHNQDNREHDLLDSDDYYQFEGGLALVVRRLVGARAGGLSQRPFAARDGRASAPCARRSAASCAGARSIRNGSPA